MKKSIYEKIVAIIIIIAFSGIIVLMGSMLPPLRFLIPGIGILFLMLILLFLIIVLIRGLND